MIDLGYDLDLTPGPFSAMILGRKEQCTMAFCFCEKCADGAMDSGVFRTVPMKGGIPECGYAETCECRDPGCPVCHGSCTSLRAVLIKRIDMD